jgi:hypothetical protein
MVLGRSLVKEGNGFEGWKKEILRRKTAGRLVVNSTATGRLDGRSKYFVTFGERRKRKGFWEFCDGG